MTQHRACCNADTTWLGTSPCTYTRSQNVPQGLEQFPCTLLLPYTLHLNLPFRSICPVRFYGLVVSSWLCHFELGLIFFFYFTPLIKWAFVSYVQPLGAFAGSWRFCLPDLAHEGHTHTPWLISFITTAHLECERLLFMALIPFTYTLQQCKHSLSHERIRSRNWATFLLKLDWEVPLGESYQGHLTSHEGQSC